MILNYPGRLDTTEETEKDLKAMQATGRTSFMRFQISDSTCKRLVDFIDEYKARGYDKVYAGLNARPRYGQGSGCAAFGAAFAELAGVKLLEFDDVWMRSLIMPRRFMGGALTGVRVSFLKILLALSAKWDQDFSRNGFLVHFYDPAVMDTWTRSKAIDVLNGENFNLPWPTKVGYIDKSMGLDIDATSVATPTEPLFFVPVPAPVK